MKPHNITLTILIVFVLGMVAGVRLERKFGMSATAQGKIERLEKLFGER